MRSLNQWLRYCVTAVVAAAALLSPNAFAGTCDRDCLTATMERYLAALVAHDPSKAPLKRGVRYTENGVELNLPDGLWRTVTSIGSYRLFVVDPRQGMVEVLLKGAENQAPVLVSVRLKVEGGDISEIESLVARLSETLGGSPANLRDGDLGDVPRPQFTQSLAPQQRRSREQLASIVNSYFTGLENNTGDKPPPFAADCLRIENGTQTSGRPVPAGAQPNSMNYSCQEAFGLGYYREDTRLRNRRIIAIDEERGLVLAGVAFDHDATIRSYALKDGRVNTVRNTAPWTWLIHEIFQINADGKISQIEAVLLSVPYGMRPGWATGVHMPSPQAIKDGYREY